MAEEEYQSSQKDNSDGLERNKIHERVPSELIPNIGQQFESEDAAYQFYNSYAYKVGFSIRKGRSHKGTNDQIVDRLFLCSCEGHHVKGKRDVNVRNPRAQSRFGCLARMKISNRLNGKLYVTEFIADHNHETSTPSKSRLHRSHRKITPSQAVEVELVESSGITPKASCELMAKRVGGRENLGFIPEDYRNYLRSKRTIQMRPGDTSGVLEYLQKMQSEDPNFFYAIQVDEDDLITNIFWADAKMMIDYSYFGNVVCFDTTYRKNREGRPFAMFVGVNHDKLNVIFGAALLYDETPETFVWLFNTFAKAMLWKKPQTILIDQDAAMAKALSIVWPKTCHRLCIWHLYQNALKKLSAVFGMFQEFSKDFSKCIYECEEEEEFLEAWKNMLNKYGLVDNGWLKQTFGLKEKWALRLVDDRRYEESKADFKATQRSLTLSFDVEILRHATTVYTPAIFKMFQSEVSRAYDCSIEISFENENVIEYKVIPHKKCLQHTVKYDSGDGVVTCSCKKFEFSGILCSYALKVLSSKNIMKIPEIYILKRWTKHAKTGCGRSMCNTVTQEDPKVKMATWYTDLCRNHADLAIKGSQDEEVYKIAGNGLITTMEAINACLRGKGKETSTCERSTTIAENVTGINKSNVKGIKIKEKPRGTSKRPKGILERNRKKKKIVQENEHSIQNINYELPSFQSTQVPTYVEYNDTFKDSSSNVSMTGLLQAQLSGTRLGKPYRLGF